MPRFRRDSTGLRRVDRVGTDVQVIGRVHVENLGHIEIGDRTVLMSSPVPTHLVTHRDATISIGSDVVIGSASGIAASLSVSIGDGVQIGRGVLVFDTDFHDVDDRGASGASAAVVIEADAWIGDEVVVLKGAHIGRGARVANGSVVSGVIAANSAVSGVPARAHADARERRGEGAGASAAVGHEMLVDIVQTAVAEVFGLATLPKTTDGPDEIERWDSLGALRLVLALEERLGVVLDAETLVDASSIDALALRLDAQLAVPTAAVTSAG